MRLRKFSALSDDHLRLYVPIKEDKLLRISSQEITEVLNGDNRDAFWLEHPYNEPFQWTTEHSDGLRTFERLLVETQACSVPAMRWLVAMNVGLFPYVREGCPARFLMEMLGPTQSGKTSGAQRFTLLHGLGGVKGDFSMAGLAALGDIGLLVMDNKEQVNFTQLFIDLLLLLATGAERGRAHSDGTLRAAAPERPVGILTSIEGVIKPELIARTVNVAYGVPGPRLQREPLEREIKQRRSEISSALVLVLQRYLQIRGQGGWPNPRPEFEEHFSALCDLMRAYGEVAGKPVRWAADIVEEWARTISDAEVEEDDLEQPLLRIINQEIPGMTSSTFVMEPLVWKGVAGSLFIADATGLLSALQRLNLRDLGLPKSVNGLTRRLRSARFAGLTVIDEKCAPKVGSLKRAATRRPIGLWVPDDDGVTVNDDKASQTSSLVSYTN